MRKRSPTIDPIIGHRHLQAVQRGLLSTPSPAVAATTLNWLVLAALVNEAMLLGDEAIPTTTAMRAHAAEATRVFLTAYASDTGLDDLR
ncbi:hypothetical protein E3N86_05145 [Cryobacterium sp. Hz7]|nr:hypothetical protein E3N86_05145 [Cryobacterium sp. Hz7]